MSDNLLDGLTPELKNGTEAESDGTWHHAARTQVDMHDDWLIWELPGQTALETDQTYHVGLSVMGASANAASLHTSIGYEDAAGNHNWATSDALAIGTSWDRDEATIIVPSGMRPFAFYVSAWGACPEAWMAAPTLSLGSPLVLAIASSTLAWSAGIVATTRYYQLSAPTAATPTVPASSSDLGSWSETEPAADVTKVLWTCECTVYADGTESWSKASKSTSYEAAKDAKDAATGAADAAKAAQSTADGAKSTADKAQSTANTAKGTADNLATLIHEGEDGITVGKSADGKTFTQGRTHMGQSSFDVLDGSGTVVASLASGKVSLLGGDVSMTAYTDGSGQTKYTDCDINSETSISMSGGSYENSTTDGLGSVSASTAGASITSYDSQGYSNAQVSVGDDGFARVYGRKGVAISSDEGGVQLNGGAVIKKLFAGTSVVKSLGSDFDLFSGDACKSRFGELVMPDEHASWVLLASPGQGSYDHHITLSPTSSGGVHGYITPSVTGNVRVQWLFIKF